MSTSSTSLSSFFINKNNILKIQDELKNLKQFSNKDFTFQIQDKINSTLAIIKDCLVENIICYEMFDELQVLETYNKHKNKSKVGLILRKYNSIKNLLNKCNLEINHFHNRLDEFGVYLKDIQNNLIESNELICHTCKGNGETIKTKYVRERGSSPQPYIKRIQCKNCNGTGKILLSPEIKNALLNFIQQAKPILRRFKVHKKTLSAYVMEYKIPSLEGYDKIESIFPEEDTGTKKIQKPLSTYYETGT